MKSKLILLAMFLGTISFIYSQSMMPINFDIRGRGCEGGMGLCSAHKMTLLNENISIQKIETNTFVLSITRASLSEEDENSIAGSSFAKFNGNPPEKFVQSENLKFSDEVLQTLGIPLKFNLLKKGSYPMRVDKDKVKITLTLSEGDKN